MCQERANLILVFSRCLKSLMVRAGGGVNPKPIELAKRDGHHRARRDLNIILGMETWFCYRPRWGEQC